MHSVISDNLTFLFPNLFRNAFALSDTNKDGYVDFKECILAFAVGGAVDLNHMLEVFFQLLVQLSVVI